MRALRRWVRSRWRRDRRAFLFRLWPTGAVCAEIGVWKGELSRRILDEARPKRLHLIDPWEFQPGYPTRLYGGSEAKSQKDMDAIHDAVAGGVGLDPRVQIHRKRSTEAADEFPDEYFDWVYIDANHSYEHVKEDLERYRPTVKRGGLVTGDDYRKGVKQAVDEAVREGRLALVRIRGSQFVLRRVD